MLKEKLNVELNSMTLRNNLLQKEVSGLSKIPVTTISGYFTGKKEMPINQAVKISESVNDDLLKGQMSFIYFKFIKPMDGKLSEVCTISELDLLEKVESHEREELKERAYFLVIQSKVRELERCEVDEIKTYIFEFLDEIVIKMSIVLSLLKIVGMTMSDAFEMRLPKWQNDNYMGE